MKVATEGHLLPRTLRHLTGNGVFDSIAAILIGVILAVVAFLLARESKALLLGEGASDVDDRAIRAAVAGVEGAVRLVDLRTMHMSPNEILVAAEVEFEQGLETAAIESAIERLEAEIQSSVPAAGRIYVEPA
jgi:divalent metal cation (Fe/Co/Zn/Cd) transporter